MCITMEECSMTVTTYSMAYWGHASWYTQKSLEVISVVMVSMVNKQYGMVVMTKNMNGLKHSIYGNG